MKKYYITNITGALVWSNECGFTSTLQDATIFSAEDMHHFKTPIGGYWIPIDKQSRMYKYTNKQ